MTSALYDRDFYLWLETTAKLLRSRQLDFVDYDNLIEEIESMGRSEKRAVESDLIVLLMHLLKYKYQVSKRSNSWKLTIKEHRRRLNKAFKDSPSLKPYFAEVFDECYQEAREDASLETDFPIDTFPTESPFTPEEVLNPDYLPESRSA